MDYIADGGLALEITDAFEINQIPVWEQSLEAGNIAGNIYRTTYNVYVDGTLYATVNQSDLETLPTVRPGMVPYAPETLTIDASVQLHTPYTFIYPSPDSISVTLRRGTLAHILETYDHNGVIDNYLVGPDADVIAFVYNDGPSDGSVIMILARDIGPIYIIDITSSGIVHSGCSIEQTDLSHTTLFIENGENITLSIPGSVMLGEAIQWSVGGQNLSNNEQVHGADSRTLVIQQAASENSGDYSATYNDGNAIAVFGPVNVQVEPPESSGTSGDCFIATAAYGTPMAGEVGALRGVRDAYLLTNVFGTAFVDIYYRVSPPIADIVRESPGLRVVVRLMLLPIILLSSALLAAPLSTLLVPSVGALLLGYAALHRLRRRIRAW